jgi:hypothetical protein
MAENFSDDHDAHHTRPISSMTQSLMDDGTTVRNASVSPASVYLDVFYNIAAMPQSIYKLIFYIFPLQTET